MANQDTHPWRRGRFSMDILDEMGAEPFEGWTRGYHWNGWAVPAFERAEAERLARFELDSGLGLVRFDDERGLVGCAECTNMGSEPPEYSEMSWYTVEHLSSGTSLYPIGAENWCWEEVIDDRYHAEHGD